MPLRPRVVAVLPRLSPSAWINVIKPLVALHESGRLRAWITLESLASPHEIQQADAVVFSRNVSPDRAGLLRTAVRHGVPVLYDLDDNFFEIPPDSTVGRACAQPRHLAMLREYLTSASLVRVYSRPLLARVAELNPNVEMVASAVDLHQIRTGKGDSPVFADPLRGYPAKIGTAPHIRPAIADQAGPIRLVYATSRLDDSLGEIFLPALRRLLDDFGPRIEVHFWGPRPPRDLGGARHHAVIHDYDRFLRRFSATGFQIGLAPLADDLFHRSKTNTKFREYGACRIAGVYSNVDVYADCVRDGETGLLTSNTTAAWYEALRRLIEDADLRTKIQRQARATVEERYSQERFETLLLEQIERLVRKRPPPRELAIEAAHAGPSLSRTGRLAAMIPQAIGHVRRHGIARGWNALRWLSSSGWSLARLQWRLRERR